MSKTQKVFWWRTGFANTEGKLGKEPNGEMGSKYLSAHPPGGIQACALAR